MDASPLTVPRHSGVCVCVCAWRTGESQSLRYLGAAAALVVVCSAAILGDKIRVILVDARTKSVFVVLLAAAVISFGCFCDAVRGGGTVAATVAVGNTNAKYIKQLFARQNLPHVSLAFEVEVSILLTFTPFCGTLSCHLVTLAKFRIRFVIRFGRPIRHSYSYSYPYRTCCCVRCVSSSSRRLCFVLSNIPRRFTPNDTHPNTISDRFSAASIQTEQSP